MTQPWCRESGRVIAYARGHRVRCACGKRVLLIGHKLSAHRVSAQKRAEGSDD